MALAATLAVEAAILLALPIPEMIEHVAAFGLLATMDEASPMLMGLLIALTLTDMVRAGLYEPLRRAVIGGETVERATDALKSAAARVPALVLLQQVVGSVVMAMSLVMVWLDVQIQMIPIILVSFLLTPAFYLVSAHRRATFRALRDSLSISRRNVLAVFGVQTAVLIFGQWVAQLLQSLETSAGGHVLAYGWGAVTAVATYRMVHFAAHAVLFTALERGGHCEVR